MRKSSAPTLQETKQHSVRTAIGDHAAQLFLEHGYGQTTVDDIARAAGIGRRTFFRYFETKDDVLLWRFDQFAKHAVSLLTVRPSREDGLTALEHALTEASEFYNQTPEVTLLILRLVQDTPALYAQQLLQQDRWKGWFAAALRTRAKLAASSLEPEITAGAGFEVMATAVRRWVDAPAVSLSEQIARCFTALRKVV